MLDRDCHQYRVFGSRSMGTDRPNSDIDLAIWGDLSELSIGKIQLELDELPLGIGNE